MANGHVTLEQLEPHHCRFPIGTPGQPDFVFCGEFKLDNLPYCEACSRIAYQPRNTSHADIQRQARPSFVPYRAISSR
jgi:hypothetical protein